jgi:hypothetical protein
MKNTIIVIGLIVILAGGVYFYLSGNDINTTDINQNNNTNEAVTVPIETNINTNSMNNTNTSTKDLNEPGLVAHWKFDEESGNNAMDSVSNKSEVVIGGATWESGKIGNALYFDGVDDYVDLSQSINDLSNLDQGTIAFWFKYNSILDSQPIMPILHFGIDDETDQSNMFIIEIGHGGTESNGLTLDSSNKKLYVTWIKDNQEPFLCFDTNENLAENTWHHFAVTVGPDGNTGYLNGVELDSRDYNFGTSSDQSFFSSIPVQKQLTLGLGRTHHEISPEFINFKGYLDDVRIYNQPLSVLEIKELVN